MHQSIVGNSSLRLITAGILTSFSSASLAAGFALFEQSASQMGNSFAGGSAYAYDASTIFFNPAGMTRLPRQFVGAIHAIRPSAKFDGTATSAGGLTTVSGGNGGDTGSWELVPNLYYSTPLGDGLFAGLGINVPFGLSTEYDSDWKGRYHAIESEVLTVNINPSMAYKVNSHLSIGAGISLQYIDAKLTQAIDQGSLCAPILSSLPPALGANPATCAGLTPQSADAFAKVEGDNWAGGWNLGLLYEFSSATRVGLHYRSKISHQLTGKGKFRNAIPQITAFNIFTRTDVTADVDLPQTASLSAWHDINTQWSVMADATWTGWDNFDELRIKYDSLQTDSVTVENWDDVMRYSLGVDYRHNSDWTFRAGAAFDESPIPNSNRTARIPGEDRIWVSLGVGYQITPTIGVDVGYAHLFIDDPELNESSANAGTLTGDYDADVNIVSAQVVWDI